MRFPKRTLVLMILAMLAFAWMFWRTHDPAREPAALEVPPIQFIPVEGGDR